MVIRDIYETGFDEDAQTESSGNQCPECEGRVTTNAIETICEDCGLVIDENRIDHGPEWRAYDEDERERTGAPLTETRHDRGLSTEIGRGTDSHGNELSGQKRRRLSRMRREQTRGRWRSKAERNLAHGLGEMCRLSSALGLPDSVRDQACHLFRSAQNDDLLRGRSIEAIAAASVFAAWRCNGLPRTIEEIAGVASVDPADIENGYTVLNRELGLPAPPMRPSAYVPRFASTLDLPERIRSRALELAEAGEDAGLATGVQPSGFAAACIYQAGQEQDYPLTQARIADVARTSTATVRTHRDALVDADL